MSTSHCCFSTTQVHPCFRSTFVNKSFARKSLAKKTNHEIPAAISEPHREILVSNVKNPFGCSSTGLATSRSRLPEDLLFSRYMSYQTEALAKHGGLRYSQLKESLAWKSSSKGQIENRLMTSKKLRRIRFTYFDAGETAQAFNSLCYPDFCYDVPLLGIDLISLGKSKILCVMDFLPITPNPEKAAEHTKQLAPIRARFLDLCHSMTERYYDVTQFFSPELIVFKSSLGPFDPVLKVPDGRFFQLFKEYIRCYLELIDSCEPRYDEESVSSVMKGHAAYEKYNADRDPAVKLMSSYFGKEWSEEWSEDFLFPMAGLHNGGGAENGSLIL